MASKTPIKSDERLELDASAASFAKLLTMVGAVAILAAVGWGAFGGAGIRKFYFAYLLNYAFVLSLALGALLFVLIHHVTKAGWSVTIRRIAENLTGTLPLLAILSAPIVASVWMNDGALYPWAQPLTATSHEASGEAHATATAPAAEHSAAPSGEQPIAPAVEHQPAVQAMHEAAAGEAGEHGMHGGDPNHIRPMDELIVKKRAFLSPATFTVALVIYFAVWIGVARYCRKMSLLQDQTGDVQISKTLSRRAAPMIVLTGITLTLASFHLVMSLDPHWFSTIFGVYYFAGSMVGFFALTILIARSLQRRGYLVGSINAEHYHDLGKYLFAFTFFWGYIAFSQYMLIWYASLPETTMWFARHGASADVGYVGPWSGVLVAILFGQLLIPFAGLLSRHVKRRIAILSFWAVWQLAFHWLDLAWVVMPEYDNHALPGLMELLLLVGLGSLFLAAFIRTSSKTALRPVQDPRLPEALAFHNL